MLATLASLTSANRIKRGMNELGVYISIIQTPHVLAREGCGYSLRFDDNARKLVESTASDLGIKIRAFYTETVENNKISYKKL